MAKVIILSEIQLKRNNFFIDSQHDMMASMGGTDNKDYYQKKDENYRTINDKLNEFLAN